jgi:hypothetical protein
MNSAKTSTCHSQPNSSKTPGVKAMEEVDMESSDVTEMPTTEELMTSLTKVQLNNPQSQPHGRLSATTTSPLKVQTEIVN